MVGEDGLLLQIRLSRESFKNGEAQPFSTGRRFLDTGCRFFDTGEGFVGLAQLNIHNDPTAGEDEQQGEGVDPNQDVHTLFSRLLTRVSRPSSLSGLAEEEDAVNGAVSYRRARIDGTPSLVEGGHTPMAPDRKTLIGKVFEPVTYTIREEDIRDYLPVAGEDDRAFHSEAESRAAGYGGWVIPPSFGPYVAVISMLRSFDWQKDFFMDYKKDTAMFGEQELEYQRPLYVGETLTVQGRVSDVYEKQGKRAFDVIWVSFAARDESGATAFSGAQSYLVFK